MFYGLNDAKAVRFREAMAAVTECYPRLFANDMLITIDRNMSFYDDTQFMRSFNAAAETAQERSLVWRLHVLAWAGDHCRHLPGDFVECGVFRGFSTAVLAHFLDFGNLPKQWFLYDTFSGVPEDQLNSHRENPEIYQDPNLHAYVSSRFKKYPNIQVVRGRVPEVLAEHAPASIAFLHIDMNSADAELGALEQLFGRVVPGGMVILDDYGWFYYSEQKHVEDAFFVRAGYRVLELPTGQGLIVKR
jgi:O-methyltransferase